MRRLTLAVVAMLACGPASAHRYCQGIDASGRFARLTPDLNGERTEYWVEEENTFVPSGERTHAVVFSGLSTPICSLDECERYKKSLNIDAGSKPSLTIHTYCAPH